MGIINRSFKIRIYPTPQQIIQINKTLGSSRAIYNIMLQERMEVYEALKNDKERLYSYKYKTEKQYKEEFSWLKEADSVALQQSRIDLTNSFQNFYKSLKGQRKGNKIGFPRYKKKKLENSYRTFSILDVNFKTKQVKLSKLGWVKYRDKRTHFDGKLKNATVQRTSTGKYFVSLLFEQELFIELETLSSRNKVIGLDMSLDKFFVDQDGNSPAYERVYRLLEPKLKQAQRRMSKKQIGSKNWYKALHKVSLIYEQIANKRKDFTHKLSTAIVQENEIIVLESLSLKGMSQALQLGKSVMDLGYSTFVKQLQYKALEQGKLILKADKWFASSKLCNVCGFKNIELKLSDRTWTCPTCSTEHNRDQNAGQNLVNYGLNFLGMGHPNVKPVEKTLDLDFSESQQFSLKQEASSF